MKRHYIESGRAFINGMGKSGFRGATSDKRYLQILKYIGDHDGCTKMDILRGIGSNNFGAGQYSDMFSALKIAGLIDYDRKNNEYHITEEGDEVLKNSYLNDMERTVTGRKKFESTHRKHKIQKLNITKEAFEKSKYFKTKYGNLEYVSESGKMFKTNKGKILMFKESIKDIAPGIQDWGSTIYVEPLEVEMSWDDVYYIVKKDCRQYPLLEEELGLAPYEEPSDEQIREWIETNPKSFMDYLEEFGSYNATDFSGDDEYDESTKESDEWDDAIFKPSNELQKLYKQLKARYERGDIEIRLADMQFGTFWLVVEVPEDDVKTLDKMEKILKSKCEGNENWEVFREEHLYGNVSKVAIQEKSPKEDKEDEERPVSEPKPPFMGIKGTQDHGSFIMYRKVAIEKDELFEGIQAMLDDEGIDASAEDWASDPKNKREVREFLMDYAHFAKDY